MAIGRLKRRAEFVACASRGRKVAMPGMVVQGLLRATADGAAVPSRVGFTVTKRVGNSVVRNRVRRRLREAARLVFAEREPFGHDLVLIGREGTTRRDFARLREDLERALARLDVATQKRA